MGSKTGQAVSPDGLYSWNGKKWVTNSAALRVRNVSHQLLHDARVGPEYERALIYERIVALDPLFIEPMVALATEKANRAQYHDVGTWCRRVLRVEPGNLWGRWLLADAFLNQQLPDDAIPLYEGLLAEPHPIDYMMAFAQGAGVGYRMKGDPVAALRVLRSIDIASAPIDEDLRSWVVSRAVVKYAAGEDLSAMQDLDWVELSWPGASGVATLRARMVSGELKDVVGPERAGHSPSVTHCPVCGAPRRAVGVIVCHFCGTAF